MAPLLGVLDGIVDGIEPGIDGIVALTEMQARNARGRDKAYKLADSGGLYLFVATTGARSWRLNYRFGDLQHTLTFGRYPEIGLAEARSRRDEARAILSFGKNPKIEFEKRKQAREAAARVTFQISAEEWMEDELPGWSASHAVRVRNRLERDLFPAFGKVSIGEIDGPMVLKALRKIETRGSIETAKRVRGYVLEILRRAKGEKLVTADQIEEIRDVGAALKPAKVGVKQPALLSLVELTQLQQDVDKSLSDAQTKLASRLLALTVMRQGVLRAAEWHEFEGIDWDKPEKQATRAIWRIPASRMKLEVEDKGNAAFGHEIPLSRQAVEVLRALRTISGARALVFPGDRCWREPMSDAALSSLYKRMKGGAYKGRMVPHGWRASFSTIMNERAAMQGTDGDRLVIDVALAHVPPGMSASEWAYNRARYLEPRRNLLQVWADMVSVDLASPWEIVGMKVTWVRHGAGARPRGSRGQGDLAA